MTDKNVKDKYKDKTMNNSGIVQPTLVDVIEAPFFIDPDPESDKELVEEASRKGFIPVQMADAYKCKHCSNIYSIFRCKYRDGDPICPNCGRTPNG